jgi:hypothetical protein
VRGRVGVARSHERPAGGDSSGDAGGSVVAGVAEGVTENDAMIWNTEGHGKKNGKHGNDSGS